MTTDDLLVAAADRAASRPFYLAGPIRAWQAANGKDAAETLAYLGAAADARRISPDQQLARIALCRAPVDRADFLAISARFGIDPHRLARLVLEANA
jgi:hypothetical protein